MKAVSPTLGEALAKIERLTARIMEYRAVECPNCAEWQRVNAGLVMENRQLKDMKDKLFERELAPSYVGALVPDPPARVPPPPGVTEEQWRNAPLPTRFPGRR